MKNIDTNIKNVINEIKTKTGNSPDLVVKNITLNNTDIAVIFNESLTDKIAINDYILEFFTDITLRRFKTPELYSFIKQHLTTHKTIEIHNYKDLFYSLNSGFTLIIVDKETTCLAIETKTVLYSGILEAKNEPVTKGPKDSFTENYQVNIGLIRKRIKTENLRINEHVIGNASQTKVSLMYIDGVAPQALVDEIEHKIKQINIDAVLDSNYIVEAISENKNNVFPNYLSTERPDLVSIQVLEGRIAIIVENTPEVVVVPTIFANFFNSPEDYYQKNKNANFTRVLRLIAFIITILAPAFYISLSTYNLEAIPTELLISFASQKEGVPLPTVLETLALMIVFEILRETDTRSPIAVGSSLSIVGALVLGQSAVSAGVVSPITVIVVAITAISGLISYSVDIVSGIRLWRFIFIVFAAILGTIGILLAGFLFLVNISSIKSFGVPYLTPFAPFNKKEQGDALLLTNEAKLNTQGKRVIK